MSEMSKVKRYVELSKKKDELDDEIDKIKDEMDELEDDVKEFFMENEIDHMDINGRTPYIRSQIWTSVLKDTDEHTMQQVMDELGADHLIEPRVNTQSLSAVVREQVEQEFDGDFDAWYDSLSETAKEALSATEKHDIRVRSN